MRNIKEVIINGISLEKILEKHKKWLNKEEGGEKADLSYADLSNADLGYVDLTDADLSCADLSDTDLTDANLKGVDLRHANLRGADLSYADLTNTNLRGADLRDVNLRHAILRFANLNNIEYDENTSFFALQCPEEGSFIGYKKANNKIVKLLITEDAKRSSATSRKCRCNKAKVLSITNINNTEEYDKVISEYDKNFIYKVGEIIEVKDFDEDRWNECSTGIHFFITRDEAVRY